MKTCTRCSTELPATLEFFYAAKGNRDGLYTHCKQCHNKITASWTQRHPAYSKDYYQEHCEELKEHANVYRSSLVGFLRRMFYNMNQRCSDPEHVNYSRYGGRGIKVVFLSFEEFFSYVTNVLQVDPRGLEIHRTENIGHYRKGNIEFLTRARHISRHVEDRKLIGV